MKRDHKFEILLIDDDPVDRELFIDAISKIEINCAIREAAGADEAIQLLTGDKHPNIIILDLNMPLKDGRQTLKELKSRTDFRHIPVIILSTSNSLFDIREAYESGAALFLEKPHDFQELVEMLQYLLPLAGKYALFAPSR